MSRFRQGGQKYWFVNFQHRGDSETALSSLETSIGLPNRIHYAIENIQFIQAECVNIVTVAGEPLQSFQNGYIFQIVGSEQLAGVQWPEAIGTHGDNAGVCDYMLTLQEPQPDQYHVYFDLGWWASRMAANIEAIRAKRVVGNQLQLMQASIQFDRVKNAFYQQTGLLIEFTSMRGQMVPIFVEDCAGDENYALEA